MHYAAFPQRWCCTDVLPVATFVLIVARCTGLQRAALHRVAGTLHARVAALDSRAKEERALFFAEYEELVRETAQVRPCANG